ncbi:MAG: hypothetical protein JOZ56_00595 [Actinobacteria bacterium]|nr:hypothetical protein [Actinomycetota bacterium]
MNDLYRRSTWIFGVVAVGLGIALVARTAAAGGGTTGYVVGVLFVALGCGRIYLLKRR